MSEEANFDITDRRHYWDMHQKTQQTANSRRSFPAISQVAQSSMEGVQSATI